MPKMINELYKNSELGFICHEQWFGRTTIMVQYWKSYEHLENYAKNKTLNHLPEWAKFNKILSGNGDVGIWHEIYLSQKGNYECLYNNMPRFGLGKAGTHVKVSGKSNSARGKLTNKDGLA